MKEKLEKFKESLTDVMMMSRKEFLLTAAVCVLGGIVFGLFFSPKKTTMIGSNNGNNSGNGNLHKGGRDGAQEDGGEEENGGQDKNDQGDTACGECGRKRRGRKWKKEKDAVADWEEVKEVEL